MTVLLLILFIASDYRLYARLAPAPPLEVQGRIEQRFTAPNRLNRSHQIIAANPAEGRVAWVQGLLPRQRLSIWQNGSSSPEQEGAFHGGAVARTQALIFTGRIGRSGTVSLSDGKRAARFQQGGWHWLDLPAPAERNSGESRYSTAALCWGFSPLSISSRYL
jgi:hypothetical protein